MMNTKLKSLFVFKSSDKIIVNQVTVFITVENECMILEVVMIRNRNVPLSSGSLIFFTMFVTRCGSSTAFEELM
jgi:hypothetical protein